MWQKKQNMTPVALSSSRADIGTIRKGNAGTVVTSRDNKEYMHGGCNCYYIVNGAEFGSYMRYLSLDYILR